MIILYYIYIENIVKKTGFLVREILSLITQIHIDTQQIRIYQNLA